MLYSDLIVNQPRIPCNAILDSSGLSQALPVPQIDSVTIVSRAEWGARESKEINYMGTPVSVVFVHHTTMNECLGQDECAQDFDSLAGPIVLPSLRQHHHHQLSS